MTELNTRKPSEERVWEKYYENCPRAYSQPQMSMYEYLCSNNKENLDKPAVNFMGSCMTFRELINGIDQVASSFKAIGVKPGELITFVTVATPESIKCVYALNKIGAVANLIDPRFDVPHITEMLRRSGSRKLVFLDAVFPKVKSIIENGDVDVTVVLRAYTSLSFIKSTFVRMKIRHNIPFSEKVLDWKAFVDKGNGVVAETVPYVKDTTAVITYTGGTTGFPKGVMLTSDSMNSVVEGFMSMGLSKTENDRFLGIIPIFTSYGIVCGLHTPLCEGVELVIPLVFKPAELGKLIKKYRPNHMIATPALYEALIESKEVQNMDLSFLTHLICGGDTVNESLEKRFNDFFKAHNVKFVVAQGYGMSEVSSAICLQIEGLHRTGSTGIPCPMSTVAIIDPETDQELGYNQVGELCLTGPQMMKGYFNNQEETDKVIRTREDGRKWIYSGDLGYINEDGFVFIVGRSKRMITRFDGHKVFPINLETMFDSLPTVRNCIVTQVKDMDHTQGYYPIALVEPRGDVDRDKLLKELCEICLKQVEERGRPVDIVLVDSLPITANGKNDCKKAEAEYCTFNYKRADNPLKSDEKLTLRFVKKVSEIKDDCIAAVVGSNQ